MAVVHWGLLTMSILAFFWFIYYLIKVMYMRKRINQYKHEFDIDDEFFIRKRKAKIKLSGTILLELIGGAILFFVIAWLHGELDIVQTKSVEQLHEVSGKFVAEFHSARPAYYDIHIQDEKTGQVIVLNTDLCASPSSMEMYSLDVVTVWYGENRQANKKMVYQMKVKDKIVYDINMTNKKVDDHNVGVYVTYLTYIFLLFGCMAEPKYLDIKKYYSEVYKGRFDDLIK